MTQKTPNDILEFWFAEENKPYHFQKLDTFDQQIKVKFLDTYNDARSKKLDGWTKTAKGTLALIITLDQFPRNIFRGLAQAFASDQEAVDIAIKAIESGADNELTPEECAFLYMPLMHSENLENQERAVRLFKKQNLKSNIGFAIAHRDIIARFGRFPHRNHILNRESTPEEIAFLKQPDSSF